MYDLLESGNATADTNGRAVATLQPMRAFETWQVSRITVQNGSTTNVPTCRIYRGAIQDNRMIDGTHTGTLDHSDTSLRLHNGEELIAVWDGADAGSSSVITIEGTSRRG